MVTTREKLRTGFSIALLASAFSSMSSAGDPPAAALDAARGCAVIDPHPAYGEGPLSFECSVRLRGKEAYNIIVAHETKPSAAHWELFTLPGSGLFSAYVPGRRPDTFHAPVDIADGRWHRVGMVLEADRIRLHVDGEVRLAAALSGPAGTRIPGPLVLGALVAGELRCRGEIADARLWRGVREPRPGGPGPGGFDAGDPPALGLWRLDRLEAGAFPDASPLAAPARWMPYPVDEGPGRIAVAGGMPADLIPLPAPEDAAPLRALLRDIAGRLRLASVDPEGIRDGVLRDWSRRYAGYGKIDFPDRGIWWRDEQAAARQAYDRDALVLDSDGGPPGTVLRRTGALLDRLGRADPPPELG